MPSPAWLCLGGITTAMRWLLTSCPFWSPYTIPNTQPSIHQPTQLTRQLEPLHAIVGDLLVIRLRQGKKIPCRCLDRRRIHSSTFPRPIATFGSIPYQFYTPSSSIPEVGFTN